LQKSTWVISVELTEDPQAPRDVINPDLACGSMRRFFFIIVLVASEILVQSLQYSVVSKQLLDRVLWTVNCHQASVMWCTAASCREILQCYWLTESVSLEIVNRQTRVELCVCRSDGERSTRASEASMSRKRKLGLDRRPQISDRGDCGCL